MRQLTSLALLLGLLVCLPKPVSAQTPYVFTTEHVDIDIRYGGSPAAWEIGWHDEDNNIEYSATEALVFALPASMVTRPAGSQWDFLGTPAGNNLWILPQSQNPNLVYLGVGAEEIQPGIFSSYLETDPRINANGVWIRLDLKSVNGPGAFSAYTTDSFGNPVVWMASANGIDSTDSVFVLEGGHSHFNWAFTEPGFYSIGFEASGLTSTGCSFSGDFELVFAVNAVPEPASLLLGSSVAIATGVVYWRKRRLRQKTLA